MGDTIDFDQPPVVETVIGVQFEPLAGMTAAHFGWFWKCYLGDDFPSSAAVPPLMDQFETFDETNVAGFRSFSFVVGPDPGRLHFFNAKRDRLVQLQRSRLLLNWQKQDEDYPRYEVTIVEFLRVLDKFAEFVRDAQLGALTLNQWEMTYVNRIPRGELWNTPEDWPGVVPGLLPKSSLALASLESINGEWHHELPPRRGRLHINLQRGRLPSQEDVLLLQVTARGPFPVQSGQPQIRAGLDLGHDAIVRSFVDVTSKRAHQVWKLKG